MSKSYVYNDVDRVDSFRTLPFVDVYPFLHYFFLIFSKTFYSFVVIGCSENSD